MTGNKIEKLLACLCAPAQGIENALAQLLTQRTLDTAAGANLDVIGAIVGQPRNGLVDDDYRRYVRARIATNNSNGTTNNLIHIVKLILNITATGKIFVRAVQNATFILEVRDRAVTEAESRAMHDMLCAATSAGIRIVIVYSRQALAGVFRFNSGPGFNNGHLARGIDRNSTTP